MTQPEPANDQTARMHVFRVSEIRDNVLRRVHGYYASLQGAFAYCEAEERKQPLIDTVRFELFSAPGGEQWLIHSYYGPDDDWPEVSDLVITRVVVIPDETPAAAVLPASVDRADEVANLRTMYDAATARENELIDERDKLIRWHREDETALNEMRATIERLRAELRRVAAETRNTTEAPTPCGPAPDECGDEPCANHEREQAHAEGEHCFCGPECSDEDPS
ncbi:hypothetical protein [Streptomyces canus]|uniref:hypothetical protein n=1 Tax=Streptomyces canus TaxID=58343 RepID=UPI00278A6401|nr:hypothetical protein [Streptomyces canus]MDQ0758744.1 hypothetical protein [Streptomyces canus]